MLSRDREVDSRLKAKFGIKEFVLGYTKGIPNMVLVSLVLFFGVLFGGGSYLCPNNVVCNKGSIRR